MSEQRMALFRNMKNDTYSGYVTVYGEGFCLPLFNENNSEENHFRLKIESNTG